jgi:hypothetical protein
MKHGFVIMAVPKSGLFLKRGKFFDGEGMGYPTSENLRIHSTKLSAEKRVKELRGNRGYELNWKVMPITFSMFKETK